MTNLINVVSYSRVSTDGQAGEDKFSLECQKEDIKNYCILNNLNLIQSYADAGVSGSLISRPSLNELIKDSEREYFTLVIVTKLDRLARDVFAQLYIEKELLKNNVEIFSIAEPYRASDPAGKLFRTLIAAFAEFEKSRITERMASGRLAKAKTGQLAAGTTAFGLNYNKITKQITINNKQAEIVRKIFELNNKGFTNNKIATILNKEGCLTSKECKFTNVHVTRILKNEKLYRGIYVYSNIEAKGNFDAILN